MSYIHSLLVFILLIQSDKATRTEDYWEDYNDERNCENQGLMTAIRDRHASDCVTNHIEDAKQSVDMCKRQIGDYLRMKLHCKIKVSQKSQLLYCKTDRGTECCIDGGYECKNITKSARKYLENKKAYLENEQAHRGYRTCYPINGLDASKCAEDCDKILGNATDPLRQHCDAKNGLLKCCVRRERAFCDECRYCCTLPFCSYKEQEEVIAVGDAHLDKTEVKEEQDMTMLAIHELRAETSFYKDSDPRCLKPDYTEDKKPRHPENWDYYDPDEFYNATTQEALDKAKTVKFDKNFFNFEDPEVLYNFMGPKHKRIWRKTYGFDYVILGSEEKALEKTFMECEHTRRESKFAKTCRKDGGFFKCCLKSISLKEYRDIRQHLIDESLIAETPWDKKLKKLEGRRRMLTYSCAKRDELTGYIKWIKYKTEDVNPLGGEMVEGPAKQQIRLRWPNTDCKTFNGCAPSEVLPQTFGLVTSRQEFCQSEAEAASRHWCDPVAAESMEVCLERKSLIRPCPKETLEVLNATGDFNLDYRKNSVSINRNLKRMLADMKDQSKKSKKRKKKKRYTLFASQEAQAGETNQPLKKMKKKKDNTSKKERNPKSSYEKSESESSYERRKSDSSYEKRKSKSRRRKKKRKRKSSE